MWTYPLSRAGKGVGLLIICMLAGLPGRAQLQTTRPDNAWKTELTRRYTRLHQQTLRLAHRYGWPARKNYSKERELILQEVDPSGYPIYYTLHNTEASFGTRTASLYAGGSIGTYLSGSSASVAGRLALWDGGNVLTTHQEFGGRITSNNKSATLNDHTTHLAGTLMARGINPIAKGMAFGANLSVWDYTDDVTEMAAVGNTLLVSNHAYGPVVGWIYNATRPGTDTNLKWEWWGNTAISQTEDYLFGFYTTKARDFDKIAYSNPYYLIVRSADNKHGETGPPAGTAYYLRNTDQKSAAIRSRNDGYDVIPADATAKNVLTVGAGEASLSTDNEPASFSIAAYSGWGPTDDGRIKPDLLGIGTNVVSTLSGSTTAYGTYSGTSMASATVSGSLLLLQELYAQLHTGQVMRSATLRGLALHTADRIKTTKSTLPGPDYRQGWGLLNTEKAAQVILNPTQGHLILERSLIQNGLFSQSIVAQGNEPLIVTLCWTDPEGQPTPVSAANLNNRTPVLVNDLDVRVSDDAGTTMPWVLNPDRPELPATQSDNNRDNVEQIYIANPVPGKAYTVLVTHKKTLTYGAQPFSLVVSGLRQTTCALAVNVLPQRDTTICTGASITLTVTTGKPGTTYEWLQNGAKTGVLDNVCRINQAGYYAVRATDRNGCTGISPAVRVQVVTPALAVMPAGDVWQCEPTKPVQLSVVGATTGIQYEWLRNGAAFSSGQAPVLSITQPGTYQLKLNQKGCLSTSSVSTVKPSTINGVRLLPDVNELAIPHGASVKISVLSDPTYRYQWYRADQVILNATTNRLLVSQPGTYRLQLTQQTCVGSAPALTVRWADGTASSLPDSLLSYELADSSLTAYPNPATTQLTIRYSSPLASVVRATIYTEQGAVWRDNLPFQPQKNYFQLDLPVADLPPGHYFFRLTDGPRIRSGRFVKH